MWRCGALTFQAEDGSGEPKNPRGRESLFSAVSRHLELRIEIPEPLLQIMTPNAIANMSTCEYSLYVVPDDVIAPCWNGG